MTAAVLLATCRSLDIRLWAEDGRLRCDAPSGALNADLRAQLATRKAELLELLAPARFVTSTFGIDSRGASRTGPHPECARQPEAQAERVAIQEEGRSISEIRRIVGAWPISLRERWGRRSNELADAGAVHPDDEVQAFTEIWNDLSVPASLRCSTYTPRRPTR
jgi:hypothetical protein